MSSEPPIPPTGIPRNGIGGNGASKPAIPDHELIRRIGQGAYGEVWLARNVLGGYRAIKIVYRDSFRDERTYEREFRGIQQFEPISRTNDGLLDVLQAGRNDEAGHYYYVMELADDANADGGAWRAETGVRRAESAEGCRESVRRPALGDMNAYTPKTLGQILGQRGRLRSAECIQFGLNLTLALGHLHRHGLIHRDIKPANIIFVQDVPKLADIGLVTTFDGTCSFVGTEGFIAPEGPTSPRADLYSLGKVLYEISTGRDRKDFPEPATGFGESNDSRESAELNTVVLKACAVDPRERYQSAEEFHADLALLNSGKSVRWKRLVEKRLAFARKAGAVVGLIAALAVSGYLFQRHQTRVAIRLQRHAQDLAAQMQIQYAENLFARGDASRALAHLAQVLRRHPAHRVAAERIIAALNQRNFPRFDVPPLPHGAPLITAHFSPDRQSVVSASEDRTIHVWDAETGEERFPPVQRERSISSVTYSPDGTKIIAAAFDGSVCVLDARTGVQVTPPFQHEEPVNAVAFTLDGRWIAVASSEAKVQIFRADTGEPIGSPLIHDDTVNAIAFSPDSRWLATGSRDGLVHIIEVDSGKSRHILSLNGPVRLLRFSENGKRLASASLNALADDLTKDWQVQVWDVETGQPLADPLVHDHVKAMAFSPDHGRIATADVDDLARVWEIATGKLLFTLPHSAPVNSVAFSHDGRHILTGSVDQEARLWDAATGAPASEPMRHEGSVDHVEFSGDGERVLTAGREDKTVKLWSIRPNLPTVSSLHHDSWVVSAEIDPGSSEAVTTTSRLARSASRGAPYSAVKQEAVIVWDIAGGAKKFAPTIPKGTEAMAARFTTSGPKALIVDPQGKLRPQIWDLTLGSPVADLQPETGVTCANFSADGFTVAAGCTDRVVRIWNSRHGVSMTTMQAHRGRVNSIRFSPDDLLLVTASSDYTSLIMDATTGRIVAGPLQHDATVWFAQFSPGSDMVVTVSLDYTAKIWSTNGTLIKTLRHSAPVEYGEFSPDATRVVTASGDRTARIWSVSTGQRLTELEHQNVVLMARFSPDGLRVITASLDHTAQLWDAATGLKLAEPFRHRDRVIAVSFSPDGRQAITASLDRTAKIWEVPMVPTPIPAWLPELAEAVGGKRLNSDQLADPVPWEERVALNARIISLPATDPLIHWARNYCAEPTAVVAVNAVP